MEIFRSVGNANGAGFVLIVSGGWASSSTAINPKFADHFVQRGYTVFAVVHTSSPKFTIPEIILDVLLHQSSSFVEAMKRVGATARLTVKPGQPHG